MVLMQISTPKCCQYLAATKNVTELHILCNMQLSIFIIYLRFQIIFNNRHVHTDTAATSKRLMVGNAIEQTRYLDC